MWAGLECSYRLSQPVTAYHDLSQFGFHCQLHVSDHSVLQALNYTTWRMQTGLRLLNTMNLVKESTFPVNRQDATVTVTVRLWSTVPCLSRVP